MRQWRVGTFSLGVTLIGLGIALLLGQFKQAAALDFVLNGWPVVLFLLGGEILWFVYRNKDEKPNLKYDIVSILLIIVIVSTGAGLTVLTRVGVLPRVSAMVAAQEYVLALPAQDFQLGDNTKKIVIAAPQCKLVVRTGTQQVITATGTAQATADSRQTATKLLEASEAVGRQTGDTFYLSFNANWANSGLSYSASPTTYTLVIPVNYAIEIRDGQDVEIVGDKIGDNWVIDGMNTEIRLPAAADVRVTADVNDRSQLRGNLTWQIAAPPGSTTQAPDAAPGVHGEIIFGSGQHTIQVLDGQEVIVNKVG